MVDVEPGKFYVYDRQFIFMCLKIENTKNNWFKYKFYNSAITQNKFVGVGNFSCLFLEDLKEIK